MAKKYYGVAVGRTRGIYEKWFGPGGAFEQVNGFKGAIYKGFQARDEAEKWLSMKTSRPATPRFRSSFTPESQKAISEDTVIIYTDGGSLNNPGPGGYGVVQLYRGERKEFSGAFRLTTNNRMELMACIVGLRELSCAAPVVMYSDSKYVVDGMTKGWAKRWRKNNWMRTKTEKALNADLWSELLQLCEKVKVEFRWVKGHAGVAENERCDFLVNQAQAQNNLPPDVEYEKIISKPYQPSHQ